MDNSLMSAAALATTIIAFLKCAVSVCNHPPTPTQPLTLSGMGNEYRPAKGL